ncbi:MAG: two-component system, chemotaxis family, chemotaxis protein CheY [Solirubrobacteraceae bacterium]|nr:two-component system, chemotaxis family, chemotaxis protein CheY [Solirubrobacteraceae bacterium]
MISEFRGRRCAAGCDRRGSGSPALNASASSSLGIAACRQLRAAHGASPRIVMLTAAGREQESAALEAGADLFLTKPFSPLDLLRLVDELGATR